MNKYSFTETNFETSPDFSGTTYGTIQLKWSPTCFIYSIRHCVVAIIVTTAKFMIQETEV